MTHPRARRLPPQWAHARSLAAVAALVAMVLGGCEAAPQLPAQEILEEMEAGAPRPDVLVALPVGPRVGDENRMVVGYERDRYRVDGQGVEVLWVRRGAEGALHELDRNDVNPIIFRDDHLDGWGWTHFQSRAEAWGLRDRMQAPEIEAPQWPEEQRGEPPAADTLPEPEEGEGEGAASEGASPAGRAEA